MKRVIYSFILFVSQLIMWGCYPGGAEYSDETDIVYTNYDQNFDFKSKGTYSLPSEIVKITGDVNAPPEYINAIYAVPILNQIDANMQALGWTKVDVGASPDVQLLPAAWSSTTIVYGGYYGGYWCWYYPYYCGGGWYYPYYPVTSYTTGTLVMMMIDPNRESTDGSKLVTWTGAINGLLSGTYETNRVLNGVDQAFRQSPYLKTN